MSADTTIVMAARGEIQGEREWQWTACVVQNADDFYRPEVNYQKAVQDFGPHKIGLPWFGTMSRAKQFAELLKQDLAESGGLEYFDRPVILITKDKVLRLTGRNGKILLTPRG